MSNKDATCSTVAASREVFRNAGFTRLFSIRPIRVNLSRLSRLAVEHALDQRLGFAIGFAVGLELEAGS